MIIIKQWEEVNELTGSLKLYNLSTFYKVLFSCLMIIMVQKTLVWKLWYDPTQHK